MSKKTKIIIGAVIAVVILISGLISFGMLWGYISLPGSQNTRNINFKNGSAVMNKLPVSYQKVKSFGFSGTLKIKGQNEEANSTFEGNVLPPLTMQISQDSSNLSKYNDPSYKTPMTKNYHYDMIEADNKLFDKNTNGEWKFHGWTISPLEKDLKEKHPNFPIEPVPNINWLTLDYADNLEYIAQEGNLYHYKVKPKPNKVGPAFQPIKNFNINPAISAFDENLMDTTLSGEVWVDENLFIAKEKYRIPYSLGSGGIDIEINYKDYGNNFSIKAPIDTTSIDAEANAFINNTQKPLTEQKVQDAKNKALMANIRSVIGSVLPIEMNCNKAGKTILSGLGGDKICGGTDSWPIIKTCGANNSDTKWVVKNGGNSNWDIVLNCKDFPVCDGPANAICNSTGCKFGGSCQ
jgi:hypothetical protein